MSDDFGNFPRKWAKVINEMPDFKSKADGADEAELNKIIVDCTKTITESEKDMDADLDLQNKREAVKEAMVVYKEVKRENEAKKRYAVYLLNSRGNA